MRDILKPLAASPKLKDGSALPLMEHFYTIQGEGFHSGKPAYFVRIGGCDVGCHWCDVKESWNPELHALTDVSEIVQLVADSGVKHVVVTGGEPTLFNLKPFTAQLKAIGCTLYLETSGAYQLTGQWDWVCLSPKKTAEPIKETVIQAHELKVIIHNENDFIWAEQQAQYVSDQCILYLQPEWSKAEKMMARIVDYALANPKWRISLQSHKYMHIP